jgi:hypothetical protein
MTRLLGRGVGSLETASRHRKSENGAAGGFTLGNSIRTLLPLPALRKIEHNPRGLSDLRAPGQARGCDE